MVKVIFINPDKQEITVDAEEGENLMETAVRHDIEGILAECGGACSCATCHVYVDEAFQSKLVSADDMETDMLDCAEGVKPSSRLSCQIEVSKEMDGIRLEIPEMAY